MSEGKGGVERERKLSNRRVELGMEKWIEGGMVGREEGRYGDGGREGGMVGREEGRYGDGGREGGMVGREEGRYGDSQGRGNTVKRDWDGGKLTRCAYVQVNKPTPGVCPPSRRGSCTTTRAPCLG